MSETDKKAVNRRSERRWNLNMQLRVFTRESEQLLGHAVDIAHKGIQLVSEKQIPTGEHFEIQLEIARENGTWEKIPLRAVSVWGRESPSGLHHTGFHVFSMPVNLLEAIRWLLEPASDDI